MPLATSSNRNGVELAEGNLQLFRAQLRHVSPILNRLIAHYEPFKSILFHHA
ncbi:MAG: hypothetical protein LBV39_05675 [Bacteroidales bacterium]|nr:hypothetical protein [Bacteroidales bacterium]